MFEFLYTPFDRCSEVTSLLSGLEPMAATGLGVCLAYLGLERFRHREKIRDFAEKSILKLGTSRTSDVSDTDWFLELRILAGLCDNDPANGNDEGRDSDHDAKLPNVKWANRYDFWFRHHRDRNWTGAAAVFCLIVLFLGTAHSVGHLTFFSCLFGGGFSKLIIWVLLFCVGYPIYLFRIGDWVVVEAKSHIEKNRQNFEKLKADKTETVETPAIPAQEPAATQ